MACVVSSSKFVTVSTVSSSLVYDVTSPGNSFSVDAVQSKLKAEQKSTAPPVCAAFSSKNDLLALSSNKHLIIVDTATKATVSHRPVARTASKIRFTPLTGNVILADTSGDVYLFSTSQMNECGKYLLGHLSVLIDVLMTNDEKFIITCERDEKIRVSNYPNCYNILSYCLGHSKYVSCVELVHPIATVIASGSGDGTLRFWNYMTGNELVKIKCGPVSENNSETSQGSAKWQISCIAPLRNDGVMLLAVSFLDSREVHLFSYEVIQNSLSVSCELTKVLDFPAKVYSISSCYEKLWLLLQQERFLDQYSLQKNGELQPLPPTDFLDGLTQEQVNFVSNLTKIYDERPFLDLMKKTPIDNMTAYLERKKDREKRKRARLTELKS